MERRKDPAGRDSVLTANTYVHTCARRFGVTQLGGGHGGLAQELARKQGPDGRPSPSAGPSTAFCMVSPRKGHQTWQVKVLHGTYFYTKNVCFLYLKCGFNWPPWVPSGCPSPRASLPCEFRERGLWCP